MRGLTLKQLEAVRAIARSRTVTGAAAAAGITPSAMTTRLKELESICGVALFDRTGTGFQLSRAGAVVLDMAEEVHRTVEVAEAALLNMKGVTGGLLVIGITSTAKYFAPRLIADFAKRYPGVDISLTVGNRLETLDALRRLAIDIAIMGRPPERAELVAEAFGDHPLVIIGPPDHRLVGRRRIGKAELAAEPFLMREPGSGTRAVFEEVFDGSVTRHARFGIEIGSNETIKQGVMAGLGLALISAHTVAFEVETGRLAVLDVAGLPVLRKWFVARQSQKAVLPAMRAFWDFARAEGAGHLPELGAPKAGAFSAGP